VKRTALAAVAAFTAAAAFASIPPAYRAHLPPATRVGDVAFVSGGKNRDEALSLRRAAQEYPLELVFQEKDRAFDADWISNIPVTIRDEHGTVVLQAVSHGPIFLASLPPGRYTVEAKWDAWTFGRPVDLTEGRERVVFSWWRNAGDSRAVVRMAQNGKAPAQSIK
jgi:hypothetical protein